MLRVQTLTSPWRKLILWKGGAFSSAVMALVEEIELEDVPTSISWRLTSSGRFTTKSLYLELCKAPEVLIRLKRIYNF
jgi:hypothetical protein